MQHGPKNTRVSPRLQQSDKNVPGPSKRGERHQMGPAGPFSGLLLGRHDTENLVHGAGHVRARFESSLERDLHDQVESDGSGHAQSELQSNIGQRQLRLDRTIVGCGERRLSSHARQAHRARLLGGVQSGRTLLGHGLVRQMRQHLEYSGK